MNHKQTIIAVFCDHCPKLAMALLDSDPLCDECLFRFVSRSVDSDLIDQIYPLPSPEKRPLSGADIYMSNIKTASLS